MAELADALDLGSSGRPCRFKSCCPYYLQGFQRFLLLLKFLFFYHYFLTCCVLLALSMRYAALGFPLEQALIAQESPRQSRYDDRDEDGDAKADGTVFHTVDEVHSEEG